MTDFTESNLSSWESDPALAPLFRSGRLDTATYDCDAAVAPDAAEGCDDPDDAAAAGAASRGENSGGGGGGVNGLGVLNGGGGGGFGIRLRRRSVVLSEEEPCANPIVAIANYLFDSVKTVVNFGNQKDRPSATRQPLPILPRSLKRIRTHQHTHERASIVSL